MAKQKASKKRYNTIITIDPSSLKSYRFQDNEIKPNRLSGFKKDNFYISLLSSKDIIIDSVEVSRNIDEEDLKSAIDIQVYDELNLDPSVQYTIFYKEFLNFENSSKRKFNIFAVEDEKMEEEFKDVVQKCRYIDYIVPEPLLIKSLYRKNLLESDSVDCFLYFKKNDAFIAIYAEGEYLYSKSIGFSIEKMHEKFCELTGESIDYDDFTNFILTGSSLNISQENQRLIIKLYREIFVYINDIIFYAKRAYHIDSIDRIYINSCIGLFKNIDRYIRTYIDIEPHELSFKIAKNSKEVKSEQLHNLMILTAIDYIDEPDDSLNFSIFKRPPPFAKRASGKLVLMLFLSIFLSMAYPLYQFGYSYFLKLKLMELNKTEHDLFIEASNLKNRLSKLQKEKLSVQKKLDKEGEKLFFREKLLKQIYDKKINYPMKTKMLVRLFEEIVKHNSKIYDVSIETNKKGVVVDLSVFSRKDKWITELIKALTHMKGYSISTKEIKKDPKKNIYLSNIEVVLNDNNR